MSRFPEPLFVVEPDLTPSLWKVGAVRDDRHSFKNRKSFPLTWAGKNGEEFTNTKDANGNYLAKYEIGQISISEQLSPLIKVDMNWKNSLLTSFEIKKTRNLTMSFTNNQLTEVRGTEYIIGGGYRFKDVKLPLKFGNMKKN